MQLISVMVPVLVTLLALVLATLPIGVWGPVGFALLMCPLVSVHFWSVRRPLAFPALAAFLLGLLADILSGGPLGFWALLYLASQVCGARMRTWLDADAGLGPWLAFGAAIALVSAICWGVTSLYEMQVNDGRAILIGALLTVAGYPLGAMLLGWLDRLVSEEAHAVTRTGG